jgi:hypothetical protein
MATNVYDGDRGGPGRLEALIARCENDRAAHMTGGGNTERELREVEVALGRPLPEELRLFLSRLGGGVFYLSHEIFGARRVMIHDIELVPDLLHFRSWLGPAVPPHLLPIHRVDGRVHAIELVDGPCAAVVSLSEPGRRYPCFCDFLGRVVAP